MLFLIIHNLLHHDVEQGDNRVRVRSVQYNNIESRYVHGRETHGHVYKHS